MDEPTKIVVIERQKATMEVEARIVERKKCRTIAGVPDRLSYICPGCYRRIVGHRTKPMSCRCGTTSVVGD